jgi:hypothetical protein
MEENSQLAIYNALCRDKQAKIANELAGSCRRCGAVHCAHLEILGASLPTKPVNCTVVPYRVVLSSCVERNTILAHRINIVFNMFYFITYRFLKNIDGSSISVK